MSLHNALIAVLLVPAFVCQDASATPTDPSDACLELLERGEHLTSIDDPDVGALGREKLRQAESVCDSQQVSPELRARALILATRLYADDRRRQLEMRQQALSLLRTEAADSQLLPKALEAVADTQMVLGNFDEAIRLSLDALDERERLFGSQSREFVQGLAWLSVTYKSAAQNGDPKGELLASALANSERAVELSTQRFGPHDPVTIAASIEHADSLERLGRFDEARELQEKIAPYVDLADKLD